MHKYILLYVCTFFLLISCNSKHKEQEKGKKIPEKINQPEISEDGSPKVNATHSQIKKILKGYYEALESEDEDIVDYYAPIVQRFYNADSFSQERVLQSLRQSFKTVDSRKVELDWESLEIGQQGDFTLATFRGKTSFVNAKSGAQKKADFYNQITFDEELRILRYEDAEQAQKVRQTSRQINQSGSDGLAQVVLLVGQAIKNGKIMSLKPFIHPQHGMYLINQSGAFTLPYEIHDVIELKENAPWMSKGNRNFCKIPQVGDLPTFTCETLFSKQGCFFSKMTAPYSSLTELMEALMEAEVSRFESGNLQKAKTFQSLVTHKMIATESSTSLLFGKVDGKWCLLVIDLATYDCSA